MRNCTGEGAKGSASSRNGQTAASRSPGRKSVVAGTGGYDLESDNPAVRAFFAPWYVKEAAQRFDKPTDRSYQTRLGPEMLAVLDRARAVDAQCESMAPAEVERHVDEIATAEPATREEIGTSLEASALAVRPFAPALAALRREAEARQAALAEAEAVAARKSGAVLAWATGPARPRVPRRLARAAAEAAAELRVAEARAQVAAAWAWERQAASLRRAEAYLEVRAADLAEEVAVLREEEEEKRAAAERDGGVVLGSERAKGKSARLRRMMKRKFGMTDDELSDAGSGEVDMAKRVDSSDGAFSLPRGLVLAMRGLALLPRAPRRADLAAAESAEPDTPEALDGGNEAGAAGGGPRSVRLQVESLDAGSVGASSRAQQPFLLRPPAPPPQPVVGVSTAGVVLRWEVRAPAAAVHAAASPPRTPGAGGRGSTGSGLGNGLAAPSAAAPTASEPRVLAALGVRARSVACVGARHALVGDAAGRLHVVDAVVGGLWRGAAGAADWAVSRAALEDMAAHPARPGIVAIACGSGDTAVRVVDVWRRRERAVLRGHVGRPLAVCWVGDGGGGGGGGRGKTRGPTVLASGGLDGTVRLWHPFARRGRGVCAAVLSAHSGAVWAICSAPQGPGAEAVLCTAGEDGAVGVWDAARPEAGALLTFSGHVGRVYDVCQCPSPVRQRVASAGTDGTVRVWDLRTGQCCAVLRSHTGFVHRAVPVSDGEEGAAAAVDASPRVLTASNDGTLRMWSVGDQPGA